MKSSANTVTEYLDSLPDDRKKAIARLRKEIKKNLPKGFKEEITYGMPGYVVPFSIYPDGYHCNPEQPLPFMCIASQKNFVAVYHSGVYADKKLYDWFRKAFAKITDAKPDMGKSCIRFKKIEEIPFKLIGELAGKMTPKEWIALYEKTFKKK